MKAIIIGAGIGRLSAAIALERIGWTVKIYERAETVREVGAGVSLWPNAIKALRCGLARQRSAAAFIRHRVEHSAGRMRKLLNSATVHL